MLAQLLMWHCPCADVEEDTEGSAEAANELRSKLLMDVAKLRGLPLWPRDKDLTIRMLLRTGCLTGQPVQYRHRRDRVTLLGAYCSMNWMCVAAVPAIAARQDCNNILNRPAPAASADTERSSDSDPR